MFYSHHFFFQFAWSFSYLDFLEQILSPVSRHLINSKFVFCFFIRIDLYSSMYLHLQIHFQCLSPINVIQKPLRCLSLLCFSFFIIVLFESHSKRILRRTSIRNLFKYFLYFIWYSFYFWLLKRYLLFIDNYFLDVCSNILTF